MEVWCKKMMKEESKRQRKGRWKRGDTEEMKDDARRETGKLKREVRAKKPEVKGKRRRGKEKEEH